MKTICVAGSRHFGYEIDKKTGIWVPSYFDKDIKRSDRIYSVKSIFYEKLQYCLDHFGIQDEPIKVIHGACASGVDKIVDEFIRSSWPKSQIEIELFPADWKKYGKSAGPIRNREMASIADALILIWDGKSNGSKNCKEEFQKLGKPIFEMIVTEGDRE